MLEVHLTFFYSTTESSRFFKGTCLNYWSSYHFRWDVLFYHAKPSLLSPQKVAMKEDMHSWFQGFGYEEGFGPNKVHYFEIRRKQIHTYAILSVNSQKERINNFGENMIL